MRRLFISAFALALSSGLVAGTDAQTLVSDLEPTEPVNIEISTVERFQKDLDLYGPQLGLVRQIPSDGNPRINARIIDTQAGLTFVASSGELSLKRIEDSADGEPQYLATLQDSWSGRARSIRQGDVTLFDRQSNAIDFTLTPFSASRLSASAVVMVDASGSMDRYMPEVIQAANTLFDALPEHISCEALVFETGYRWYGTGQSECSSNSVSLTAISASGTTNLYTAMTAAYERLNGRDNDVVKTLIVLTDGMPSDEEKQPEAFAAKQDVQTIFLWLGDQSGDAEARFSSIADAYVEDSDGAWRHLEEYFEVYSEALNKQSVITVSGPAR
ncbi:MAG: vWA domain-containing protein [Pseudomonadota bacterium]